MGAFICTLSEEDWETSLTKGVYGNRYLKEGTWQPHRDVQQLSIIRDLISIKPGDLFFFHIRGKQTIHGAYESRSGAFFDNTRIWSNPIEKFPYRFLFRHFEKYSYLAQADANIDVESLYELIDNGQIKSLLTLEFEKNIERRSVRKIMIEDAYKIIRVLHRDFRTRASQVRVNFQLVEMSDQAIMLKDRLYKVGSIENAIKAVVLYKLAQRDQQLCKILNLPETYDFVNEFYVSIAQTSKKAIDVLVTAPNLYLILEFKTYKCDIDALKQSLYYRDLLRQRTWIHDDDKILVGLVAQSFTPELIEAVKELNYINDPIKLIKYSPINDNNFAQIDDDTPS